MVEAILIRLMIALAGLAVARLVAKRWRAEQGRRAGLVRSGAHWKLLGEAVGRLDDPTPLGRLEAVKALRDIAGDFPELCPEIRELLAARLRERSAAYRDEALPSDLREISRFLREPPDGEAGSWTPF